MPLSETVIRQAKPATKAIKMFDGREKLISLGIYPDVPLKLAPLTFVRPGELRHATWSEFDLDHAEWRIPAERMKMREQHIVPLSRQAVEVVRELQSISRRSSHIFPALGNVRRPMSERVGLLLGG